MSGVCAFSTCQDDNISLSKELRPRRRKALQYVDGVVKVDMVMQSSRDNYICFLSFFGYVLITDRRSAPQFAICSVYSSIVVESVSVTRADHCSYS